MVVSLSGDVSIDVSTEGCPIANCSLSLGFCAIIGRSSGRFPTTVSSAERVFRAGPSFLPRRMEISILTDFTHTAFAPFLTSSLKIPRRYLLADSDGAAFFYHYLNL